MPKKRNLSKLLACVRRDNAPMLKVFENAGFVKGYSEDFDEISLSLNIEEQPEEQETDDEQG